eukprot:scaffold633_cov288-Ochromonas_danica.AAC.59
MENPSITLSARCAESEGKKVHIVLYVIWEFVDPLCLGVQRADAEASSTAATSTTIAHQGINAHHWFFSFFSVSLLHIAAGYLPHNQILRLPKEEEEPAGGDEIRDNCPSGET